MVNSCGCAHVDEMPPIVEAYVYSWVPPAVAPAETTTAGAVALPVPAPSNVSVEAETIEAPASDRPSDEDGEAVAEEPTSVPADSADDVAVIESGPALADVAPGETFILSWVLSTDATEEVTLAVSPVFVVSVVAPGDADARVSIAPPSVDPVLVPPNVDVLAEVGEIVGEAIPSLVPPRTSDEAVTRTPATPRSPEDVDGTGLADAEMDEPAVVAVVLVSVTDGDALAPVTATSLDDQEFSCVEAVVPEDAVTSAPPENEPLDVAPSAFVEAGVLGVESSTYEYDVAAPTVESAEDTAPSVNAVDVLAESDALALAVVRAALPPICRFSLAGLTFAEAGVTVAPDVDVALSSGEAGVALLDVTVAASSLLELSVV